MTVINQHSQPLLPHPPGDRTSIDLRLRERLYEPSDIWSSLLYYKLVISRFAGEHEDSRGELNSFNLAINRAAANFCTFCTSV